MAFLAALWLPIVVSAVIVFVASSIMHMVLPYHRNDYSQLPEEDKIRAVLRAANLKRGLYVFPYCTHENMKSPALQEKYKEGPVGFMNIMPSGPPVMPKFMAQWFVFCLVISFFTAYLTWHALGPGANYLVVFRIAGCAAFMAYGLARLSDGIWRGQLWSSVMKEVFDGLVYGLLTAGAFGWLWPR
ncbi:MAG: hypothetical protein WCC04_22505 [Terriglobales bacterium]